MVRRPPTAVVVAARAAIPVETPEATPEAVATAVTTSRTETKGWGESPTLLLNINH
jgi:hypothetical protein